jgi:hypothetical protein
MNLSALDVVEVDEEGDCGGSPEPMASTPLPFVAGGARFAAAGLSPVPGRSVPLLETPPGRVQFVDYHPPRCFYLQPWQMIIVFYSYLCLLGCLLC